MNTYDYRVHGNIGELEVSTDVTLRTPFIGSDDQLDEMRDMASDHIKWTHEPQFTIGQSFSLTRIESMTGTILHGGIQ